MQDFKCFFVTLYFELINPIWVPCELRTQTDFNNYLDCSLTSFAYYIFFFYKEVNKFNNCLLPRLLHLWILRVDDKSSFALSYKGAEI